MRYTTSGVYKLTKQSRVGMSRSQLDLIDRLAQAAPKEVTLDMALGHGHLKTSAGERILTPTQPVQLIEDLFSFTYRNTHPLAFIGNSGTYDQAVFFHPLYPQEPLMAIALSIPVTLTPADQVSFSKEQVQISCDAMYQFKFPPDDYLIYEEQDLTDVY